MQVAGSRVIITGGASGLGAGTASALAARGATVVLLDLPQSKGAEVAAGLGDAVSFVPVDVTDPAAVEPAIDEAARILGGIDVCVNAAGVAPAHRVVSRQGVMFPIELFEFVVKVNLMVPIDRP